MDKETIGLMLLMLNHIESMLARSGENAKCRSLDLKIAEMNTDTIDAHFRIKEEDA